MNKIKWIVSVLLLAGSWINAQTLEQAFMNPPKDAQTSCWWHWMNGNISKKGITKDLEYMKRVGIPEATIFNVGLGTPLGPKPVFSQGWFDCISHALDEAARLDIDILLQNCPGWATSGGPWIKPEDAMKQLTWSTVTVHGGTLFHDKIPQPNTFLTSNWYAEEFDFYRDIAVVAYPALSGEGLSMHQCNAVVTVTPAETNNEFLFDDNRSTFAELTGESAEIVVEFDQPFEARSVDIVPYINGASGNWSFMVDAYDEKNASYRSIVKSQQPHPTGHPSSFSFGFESVSTRRYRITFKNLDKRRPIRISEVAFRSYHQLNLWQEKAGYFIEPFGKGRDPEMVSPLPVGSIVDRDKLVNLTDKLDANGNLKWKVPPGEWTILRMGYTLTGMVNKPAPDGGEGLECDKLSKAGIEATFNGMIKDVLDANPQHIGKTLTGILIDSYESGTQNWTAGFEGEFERRRGYSLMPYLPALAGRIVGNSHDTERFYLDFQQTICELYDENYYGHATKLANERGLTLAAEVYGHVGNMNEFTAGAGVDIPMAEIWIRKNNRSNPRWIKGLEWAKTMSSITHNYQKAYTGAEAFSALPGDASWRNHPYKLKPPGDFAFCHGISRFVLHRYCHQPWDDEIVPGMCFGPFGSHFERTVTWAEQAGPWYDYLAGAQAVLQQGICDADMLMLGKDNGLSKWIYPNENDFPAGYFYESIDKNLLLNKVRIEDGWFQIGADGRRFKVLMLQESGMMMPELLTKLEALVQQGGIICGVKPQMSSSLSRQPAADAEVQAIAGRLWGDIDGETVKMHRYGNGLVLSGLSEREVFETINLKPDFDYQTSGKDAEINFIHRRVGKRHVYFIANREPWAADIKASFRLSGMVPELWDPQQRRIEKNVVYAEKEGRIQMPLRLEECGSIFVVFHEGEPTSQSTSKETAFLQTAPRFTTALELSAPWNVFFQEGRGAPASIQFDVLRDLSKHTDEGVKYFSGTATYETSFNFEKVPDKGQSPLILDLGSVEVIAEVELNGQKLGILWKPPFRVDVTDALQKGRNTLTVHVTNLWPNRLIGDERQFEDKGLYRIPRIKSFPEWLWDNSLPRPDNSVTYTSFPMYQAKDELLPSGLLGPVSIKALD